MTNMQWLLTRMKYDLREVKECSTEEEKIIAKYAELAEIQSKLKYGDIYTMQDFIEHVESESFIPFDGTGYYYNKETGESDEETSWDIDELKQQATEYPYVVWYNR